MAAGRILWADVQRAFSSDGVVQSGALLTVYLNKTTAFATIYADKGLTTEITNPQPANAAGLFFAQTRAIWADASEVYSIKVGLPNGTNYTVDDIAPLLDSATGALVDLSNAAYSGGHATRPIQQKIGDSLNVEDYFIDRTDRSAASCTAAVRALLADSAAKGLSANLGPAVYLLTPSNIPFANGQILAGQGSASTTIKLSGGLSSSTAIFIANFLAKGCRLKGLTLDGSATVRLNQNSGASSATTTVSGTFASGEQISVDMRGPTGVSLNILINGVLQATAVATQVGSHQQVVKTVFTATQAGVMTLVPVGGSVTAIAVTENGGNLSALVSAFESGVIEFEDVTIINFDTWAVSANGCAGVTIDGLCNWSRSAPSWNQSRYIVHTNQAQAAGPLVIKSGAVFNNSSFLNAGVGSVSEVGVTLGPSGYSGRIFNQAGTMDIYAPILTGVSPLGVDEDDTAPLGLESYGGGSVNHFRMGSNPGAGIYCAGPMTIVEPILYDMCAYFAANMQFTTPAGQWGYLTSTINAQNARLIGGRGGNTTSGAARTCGSFWGDQNSSVVGTKNDKPQADNTTVSRFSYSNMTTRSFTGMRHSYISGSLTPGAIAAQGGFSSTISCPGVLVGDKLAVASLNVTQQNCFLSGEVVTAAQANLRLVNPTSATQTFGAGVVIEGAIEEGAYT